MGPGLHSQPSCREAPPHRALVYDQIANKGRSVRMVGVVDPAPARAVSLAAEFKCRAFGSVEQLLGTRIEIHAASIAVPTVQHAAVARQLMQAGVDVLIENPLTTSLAEADDLLALASRSAP